MIWGYFPTILINIFIFGSTNGDNQFSNSYYGSINGDQQFQNSYYGSINGDNQFLIWKYLKTSHFDSVLNMEILELKSF